MTAVVVLLLYFAPAIAAVILRRPQWVMAIAVDVTGAWTIVGWFVAWKLALDARPASVQNEEWLKKQRLATANAQAAKADRAAWEAQHIARLDEPIRCPKCSAAQTHAERRGWSWTTGMIGAQRVYLTCLRCGKRFNPGRGK